MSTGLRIQAKICWLVTKYTSSRVAAYSRKRRMGVGSTEWKCTYVPKGDRLPLYLAKKAVLSWSKFVLSIIDSQNPSSLSIVYSGTSHRPGYVQFPAQ